jgi:HK97 gp10 family phage protein
MAGGFMTMRVIGDDALVARLAEAMVVTEAMQPTALQQAGYLVERRAKQIVVEKDVIDTGNLLGNITTGEPSGNSIDITSEADYSVYNEFGTYKMQARPYMRPALDESKPEIQKLIGAMFMAEVSAVLSGL